MDWQALGIWASSNADKFLGDLLYSALNALVFGFVVGGVFRWFQRAGFRAQRTFIATELSQLHKTLMLTCCKAAFDAIRTRDVAAYRKAKSASSTFQNDLNRFLTTYAAYFGANQATLFQSYKRAAEDVARALDWGSITKEMQENGSFKLETMGWLFEPDHFGDLMNPSKFVATEGLLRDFLRSLGFWWVRKAYLDVAKVKEVDAALLLLKAEIEKATGKTLDARSRNVLSLKAA